MSKKTIVKTSNGVGFTGLLTLLFIGLKLTSVIDWAWLWVLSPIWISLGSIIGIVIIIMILGVISAIFSKN